MIRPNFTSVYTIKKLDTPSNSNVIHIKNTIKEYCEKHDINFLDRIYEANSETIFIAIGGDGTVLYAAKEAVKYNASVIGINLGKIGFLSDIEPDMIMNGFLDILFFKPLQLKMDNRILLEAEYLDQSYIAFNDLVISHVYSDNTINFDMSINDEYTGNHIANSLICSTPSGSTAYALNVSGAIISPSLDIIELIPVAASMMSTSLRPIIVDGSSYIDVTINFRTETKISLKSDGREVLKIGLNPSTYIAQINIHKYRKSVKFITLKDWSFFNTLATKLGWNKQC